MQTRAEESKHFAGRRVTVWAVGASEPLQGIYLPGCQEGASYLELPPGSTKRNNLQAGGVLRVVTFDARGYRVVACRIVQIEGDRLHVVSSIAPIDRQERREHARVACNLPCSYRAHHLDGHRSAWREGVVVNLSIGGTMLRLPEVMDVPKRLELSFAPPSASQSSASRMYGDDGSAFAFTAGPGDPIRSRANVVSVCIDPEGNLLVNCAFTNISAKDRALLETFLNDAAKAA